MGARRELYRRERMPSPHGDVEQERALMALRTINCYHGVQTRREAERLASKRGCFVLYHRLLPMPRRSAASSRLGRQRRHQTSLTVAYRGRAGDCHHFRVGRMDLPRGKVGGRGRRGTRPLYYVDCGRNKDGSVNAAAFCSLRQVVSHHEHNGFHFTAGERRPMPARCMSCWANQLRRLSQQNTRDEDTELEEY